MLNLNVRSERPEDFAAVEAINTEAFERDAEALLVQALRDRDGTISMVAEVDGVVCGHILFSTITLASGSFPVAPLGLGPMSVLPDRQNRHIGTALVEAGLAECQRRGAPFVVVLGHPEYYPRFGFVPASTFGVRCKWPVPDEVFMALELTQDSLRDVTGVVHYSPDFDRM